MKTGKTAKFSLILTLAVSTAPWGLSALAQDNSSVSGNYNTAGNTAQDGSNKQQSSATVHAAVGVVCGAACASFGTLSMACTGASIGAAVNDRNTAGAISAASGGLTGEKIGGFIRHPFGGGNTHPAVKKINAPSSGTNGSTGTQGSGNQGGQTSGGTDSASSGGTDSASSGGTDSASTGGADSASSGGADSASSGGADSASSGGTDTAGSADGQAGGSSDSGDNGACSMMVSEGLSAASKQQSAKNLSNTANSAYQAGTQLSTGGPSAFGATANGQQGAAAQGGSSTAQAGPGSGMASGDPTAAACGSSAGNMAASIQCALANDKTLSPMVATPQFMNALTKASGMTPDQFAQKVQTDGAIKAISDSLGATQGADVGAKTEGLLSGLAQKMLEDSGTSYAGGGGAPKAAEGEDPMGKAMQDMLAQFLPKKGEESTIQLKELAFGGGPKRYPANVAEDRRVSIFERVTNRYHFVANRVLTTFAPQQQ